MPGLWSHCLETGQSFPKKQLDERCWFMELLVLDNLERAWGTLRGWLQAASRGSFPVHGAESQGLPCSTSYLLHSAKSHTHWKQSQTSCKAGNLKNKTKKQTTKPPKKPLCFKLEFPRFPELGDIPLCPSNFDSWHISVCQWARKGWVAQKNWAITVCS